MRAAGETPPPFFGLMARLRMLGLRMRTQAPRGSVSV
jgi:hypothetical protein